MALSFLNSSGALLEILADVRPLTIMAWAMQHANGNNFSVHFALGGGGGEPVAVARGAGVARLSDSVTVFDGPPYPLETWLHLALTWGGTGSDAGPLVLYVDGTLGSTATSPAMACDRIRVGNYASPSTSRSRGPLAAIKVWNAVLTQAEIVQEMQSYLPVRTANIFACTPGLVVGEAATNYYGTAWTVVPTIDTEDGPPIAFGTEEDEPFVRAPAAPSGVNGSAVLTQAPQTLSSAAVALVQGTLARTQAAHTLSSAITTVIQGTLSRTQGAHTLSSAAGAPSLSGTAALTQAPQTATSVGAVALQGALARTQAPHTLSSSSGTGTGGTVARTQGPQTLSSAAVALVQGQSTQTQAPQTLSSVATLAAQGSLARTHAPQTVSSAATAQVQGTLARTQTAQTVSSTGGTPAATGAAALTQAPQTLASAGTIPHTGSAGLTHAPQTLASAGTIPHVGSAALTQGAQTLVASGGAPVIVGDLGRAQAPQTIGSSARALIQGSASPLLLGNLLVAAGLVPLLGNVLALDLPMVLSSEGRVFVQGNLSRVQDAQTVFATDTPVSDFIEPINFVFLPSGGATAITLR